MEDINKVERVKVLDCAATAYRLANKKDKYGEYVADPIEMLKIQAKMWARYNHLLREQSRYEEFTQILNSNTPADPFSYDN